MSHPKPAKVRPDIRQITRLVPPAGNLVQGQSELPINPRLAREAAAVIKASENHYGGSEGDLSLRTAVAKKLRKYNGISVDVKSKSLELMITNGGTGALVGIAQGYLRGKAALVFEPYYPYHRRILEEFGAQTEVFGLDDGLTFDKDSLLRVCKRLKSRKQFPLKAIIVCTPSNPCGKVMTRAELEAVADVAKELDLMVVSDEVYEHFVTGDNPHVPIATLPGMWDRTITVNSFSKSWNISGWRLGYCYGGAGLLTPINNAANVIYVCPATPLQSALGRILMEDDKYYSRLADKFDAKRAYVCEELEKLGFSIYPSGSSFYLWARIPEGFDDAISFNEMLMSKAGVAAVPGSAFADSDRWDAHMRICVAREDSVLEGAVKRFRKALKKK